MTTLTAAAVFVLSLALSTVSSLVLAHNLDKVGARLRLTEGLVGIITALGADAPEIASAVTALVGGQRDLGVGVVIGSNVFNLAALLGLSAVVAGQVRIGRQGLTVNGAVALLVTGIAAALIFGWLPPVPGLALIAAILAPYIVLLALRRPQVERLPLPRPADRFLSEAAEQCHDDAKQDTMAAQASGYDALALVPALASIVLASVGMIRSAVALAEQWGVPHIIVGTLILATLTGVPNLIAAIRLARHGRGSAVVTESLNSNTFNLVAGVALPALLLGLGAMSRLTTLATWWLLAMTAVTVALAGRKNGLQRRDGAAIIALYAVFAAVILWWK